MNQQNDPFAILGIEQNAAEQEIRQRYLALVKLHPPEIDPEKFREIHQAYQSAKDPLALAQRLIAFPQEAPDWHDVIAQQKSQPPNLPASMLIALGNRATSTSEDNDHSASPLGHKERIDQAHE